MFLRIYYFLFGYVKAFARGFSYPRFLNMLGYRGIYIWNVREEKGGISFFAGRADIEAVKSLGEKAGCEIGFAYERGLPTFLKKVKRKYFFLAGAGIFAAFLLLVTRFVWLVEIEGNFRVPTGEILEFCEGCGLGYGALKSGLDTNMIEREIKNEFEDISFVSVSVKGTRALISVSEIIPYEEKEQSTEPADIVAECGGVITAVTVRSGKPVVRAGMSVGKGDILIDAEEEIKAEQEVLGIKTVRAEGEVYAKTVDKYSFEFSANDVYKKYWNKSYKEYEIEIFNKNISLNFIKRDTNWKKCDKIESKKQLRLWNDIYLPVIIDCREILPYDETTEKLSPEKAEEKANRIVSAKIINGYAADADVLDVDVNISESEGTYKVEALITVNRQIGIVRPYDERPVEEEAAAE